MAATRADIQSWLTDLEDDITHVIIVCDTYDWDDYPVYVSKDEDVRKVESRFHGNMQQVMEVYSFTGKHTIEDQMAERRAFHYDQEFVLPLVKNLLDMHKCRDCYGTGKFGKRKRRCRTCNGLGWVKNA